MTELSRRNFLKVVAGAAAAGFVVNPETGLAVPTAYASHGGNTERPTGVPTQASEAASQVAEIPNCSNFVREGGNGWRTLGANTNVTGTFTPENGVPYILGNNGEAGNIDVQANVKKGSLLFLSFGHGSVELPECGMRWDFSPKGNDHEAKTWIVIPEDCACPADKTETVLVSGVRKGHNRLFAYDMAGVDPAGKVNRGQLGQLLDSASKLQTPITDLSLRFYNRSNGEFLMLGSNPASGTINFVDGNAPRA